VLGERGSGIAKQTKGKARNLMQRDPGAARTARTASMSGDRGALTQRGADDLSVWHVTDLVDTHLPGEDDIALDRPLSAEAASEEHSARERDDGLIGGICNAEGVRTWSFSAVLRRSKW